MCEFDIKELILRKEKEGKIVFATTIDGLAEAQIEDFIKQPIEGILYDLNRDKPTILTMIKNNEKWINDYAISLVITKLKEFYDNKLGKVEGKCCLKPPTIEEIKEIINKAEYIPLKCDGIIIYVAQIAEAIEKRIKEGK